MSATKKLNQSRPRWPARGAPPGSGAGPASRSGGRDCRLRAPPAIAGPWLFGGAADDGGLACLVLRGNAELVAGEVHDHHGFAPVRLEAQRRPFHRDLARADAEKPAEFYDCRLYAAFLVGEEVDDAADVLLHAGAHLATE